MAALLRCFSIAKQLALAVMLSINALLSYVKYTYGNMNTRLEIFLKMW